MRFASDAKPFPPLAISRLLNLLYATQTSDIAADRALKRPATVGGRYAAQRFWLHSSYLNRQTRLAFSRQLGYLPHPWKIRCRDTQGGEPCHVSFISCWAVC